MSCSLLDLIQTASCSLQLMLQWFWSTGSSQPMRKWITVTGWKPWMYPRNKLLIRASTAVGPYSVAQVEWPHRLLIEASYLNSLISHIFFPLLIFSLNTLRQQNEEIGPCNTNITCCYFGQLSQTNIGRVSHKRNCSQGDAGQTPFCKVLT